MNRNIFGWEEQGCFNENTSEALWVLGFVVFQNTLNIIVKYFCLFLGINNFEVINVFHTSCKHFSMSCTQWILVILKAKSQILEPKIACADDAWGFFSHAFESYFLITQSIGMMCFFSSSSVLF